MKTESDTEKEKCVGCKEEREEWYRVEEGPVCEMCYEQDMMEPAGTVEYMDGDREVIGEYVNQTGGSFTVEWVSTDGWRGYYSVEGHDGWRKLHEDAVLSMSGDAEDLKEFDDKMMEFSRSEGIEMARVITRTSNVFSSGYDLFYRCDDDIKMMKLQLKAVELKGEHRNPERFKETALTGKDPEDMDDKDKKLVEAVGLLSEGRSVSEAVEEVSS